MPIFHSLLQPPRLTDPLPFLQLNVIHNKIQQEAHTDGTNLIRQKGLKCNKCALSEYFSEKSLHCLQSDSFTINTSYSIVLAVKTPRTFLTCSKLIVKHPHVRSLHSLSYSANSTHTNSALAIHFESATSSSSEKQTKKYPRFFLT